jgi:hypothetical protein
MILDKQKGLGMIKPAPAKAKALKTQSKSLY